MNSLGRRIRGIIGMTLAWGFAWSAVGAVVARLPGFDSDLPFPFLFTPFGMATGLVFAGVLLAIESRNALERVSLPLFAACGAASGILVGVVLANMRGDMKEVLVFGPLLALAGAACAAGSLAVARRSERTTLPAPNGPTEA